MLNMKLADKKVELDMYKEYKKLGGKNNVNKYWKNLEVFFDETFDIYILGDTIKHKSRDQANSAIIKKAKIPIKEFNSIMKSVDKSHGYS